MHDGNPAGVHEAGMAYRYRPTSFNEKWFMRVSGILLDSYQDSPDDPPWAVLE
jgi:hypothetical protein